MKFSNAAGLGLGKLGVGNMTTVQEAGYSHTSRRGKQKPLVMPTASEIFTTLFWIIVGPPLVLIGLGAAVWVLGYTLHFLFGG